MDAIAEGLQWCVHSVYSVRVIMLSRVQTLYIYKTTWRALAAHIPPYHYFWHQMKFYRFWDFHPFKAVDQFTMNPIAWLLHRGFNCSTVTTGTPIQNDYSEDDSNAFLNNPQSFFLIGLLFRCVVFGGIHVVDWNFDFATRIELILWRVASVWCTAFTLLT
jgi:hypothetical protein